MIATIITLKSESRLMRAIAWVLGVLRIMPAERFMGKYTTTVRDHIYAHRLPMSRALERHEGMHVTQWRRNYFHTLRYLVSRRYRAFVEVEAMVFAEPTITVAKCIHRLREYRCRYVDIVEAWDSVHNSWRLYGDIDG